jgi:hypothetical protein
MMKIVNFRSPLKIYDNSTQLILKIYGISGVLNAIRTSLLPEIGGIFTKPNTLLVALSPKMIIHEAVFSLENFGQYAFVLS